MNWVALDSDLYDNIHNAVKIQAQGSTNVGNPII